METRALTSFESTAAELILLLEEENALLASNMSASHQDFASRKLRLLRLMLNCSRPDSGEQEATAILGQLKATIATNEKLLSFHMNAVREVAAIIIDSIRMAESDGTYQRMPFRRPFAS